MSMPIPTQRTIIDWNAYNLKLSYYDKCTIEQAVILLEKNTLNLYKYSS
jgi:hypothetical protein